MAATLKLGGRLACQLGRLAEGVDDDSEQIQVNGLGPTEQPVQAVTSGLSENPSTL